MGGEEESSVIDSSVPTVEPAVRACVSGAVPVNGTTCGVEDAPVTIIEFSDYQCPWCKHFVDTTEVQVEAQYIETGLARLEFRNLAITGGNLGPDENESTLAAEAAECANDQGRYWDYHYKLYAEQSGENRGAFVPEHLKEFASELGLDRVAFDECLDSHKHIDLILQQREDAQAAGIQGTPNFLVNGRPVQGYLPFEDFQLVIEEALQEARATPEPGQATPQAGEATPGVSEATPEGGDTPGP
jgi:protein-disulfide isomerase